MNFRVISRTIGMILLVEMAFMAPSLFWCWADGDSLAAVAFGKSLLIMALAAGVLLLAGHRAKGRFGAQDGFVTVGLSWIVMSLLGCLPFYLSGQIPHYVDALFEVTSGFTTTGASILADPAVLGRGLLFWRSATHWLGGMGILVFTLALMPAREQRGAFHLMRAESPGPSVGKLTPRLRHTSMILYGIYVLLTLLCILFLLAGGMPLFDSLCSAFGTAGTGGFGIRADSMAGYSPYLQWVITIFMALFGVNFSIYFLLLLRRFKVALHDEELRCYGAMLLGAGTLIAVNIRPLMASWGESFRHAFFQVSSIATTTGFSTTDFDLWPTFSKAILMCLMLVGACAGSTGGGMKVIRMLVMAKVVRRGVRRTLRPRSVQLVHVNGKLLEEDTIQGISSFLAAYWFIIFGSFILISVDGFDLTTNLSAVFSCMNNIGPGFGAVGPIMHYGEYSAFSKLILTANMLLGRLEIFPLLALVSRHSWSSRR